MPKFSLAICWSSYFFLTVRLRNSHVSKVKSVLWSWKPFALGTWMIPTLFSVQRTYNFSGARLGWGIHLDPLVAYPTNPGSCFRTPRSYSLNGVFESHIRTNKGNTLVKIFDLKKWFFWKRGSSLGGGFVLWEGYSFLEETVKLAFKVKLMEIDRNRCF